ncbi:MAG TPA: O-antigen ligase domain-containing protein [Bacteroidetes bacterium]|nr:O-antigen ligase domain-containing protein [Bacteroidota bacterium]
MPPLQSKVEDVRAEAVPIFLGLLALTATGAVVLGTRYGTIGFAAVFLAVAFGLFLLWRVETLPAITILYMSLLPLESKADVFSLPYFYYTPLSPVLMMAMLAVLFLERNAALPRTHPEAPRKDLLGTWILLLIAWLTFETLRGFALHHQMRFIRSELFNLAFLLAYYFWRTLFRWRGQFEGWMKYIAVVSGLVAIIYMYFVSITFTNVLDFIFFRIITRQTNLLIIAVPVVGALYYSSPHRASRWGWGLLALLLLVETFISQQRGLWLVVAGELFLLVSLYSFRDGWNRVGLRRWAIWVLIPIVLIVVILLGALTLLHIDFPTLFSRWKNIGTKLDASAMMRYFDIRDGLWYFKQSPLIGAGVGATMFISFNHAHFYFFDNSYIMMLFKGGLPMLLLYLVIYGIGLYRAHYVFRYGGTFRLRMFGLAALVAITGILVLSTMYTAILYYRFNFIYMMMFALVTVLKESHCELPGKQPHEPQYA